MSNVQKLTSVYVNTEDFQEFKVACVRNKFSFTKLVENAIHLFLVDAEFRTRLLSHDVYRYKKEHKQQ
jgi:hypothetical protein